MTTLPTRPDGGIDWDEMNHRLVFDLGLEECFASAVIVKMKQASQHARERAAKVADFYAKTGAFPDAVEQSNKIRDDIRKMEV